MRKAAASSFAEDDGAGVHEKFSLTFEARRGRGSHRETATDRQSGQFPDFRRSSCP